MITYRKIKDGDIDAFVGNKIDPNKVWLNDGDGNFTYSKPTLGDSWSYDVDLADVDEDGDTDAFVTNLDYIGQLYLLIPHITRSVIMDQINKFV